MIKAYSYLRFSTPEQGRGDSFRRQTDLARNYAIRNDLELDVDLQFFDYGISAFRSRNAKIGALKHFLDQIETGNIRTGSYFLIESLDRISRDEILPALNLFLKIIKGGITVVTLMDERKYSKKSVNANPVDLLTSLLIMMRAHEESETKSKRLKLYNAEKRSRVGNGEIYRSQVPMWFRINKKTKKIEVINEKAKIIMRIFKMALQGQGSRIIAKILNSEGVKTLNGFKSWSHPNVTYVINDPSVAGTLVFGRYKGGVPEDKRIPVQYIKNYYPIIVEPEIFNKVQLIRKKLRPGGQVYKPHTSIFTYIVKCGECGSSMNKIGAYLRCRNKDDGAGCNSIKYAKYIRVENALIQNISSIISSAPKFKSTKIENKLINIDFKIKARIEATETLKKNMMNSDSKAMFRSYLSSERKLETLRKEQNELKRIKITMSDSAVENNLELLSRSLKESTLNRKKINSLLRRLFSSIFIDTSSKTMTFNWIQGVRTDLKYV